MYGFATTNLSCPHCGRNCACTGGAFTFTTVYRPLRSELQLAHELSYREAERKRELDRLRAQYDAWGESLHLSRTPWAERLEPEARPLPAPRRLLIPRPRRARPRWQRAPHVSRRRSR